MYTLEVKWGAFVGFSVVKRAFVFVFFFVVEVMVGDITVALSTLVFVEPIFNRASKLDSVLIPFLEDKVYSPRHELTSANRINANDMNERQDVLVSPFILRYHDSDHIIFSKPKMNFSLRSLLAPLQSRSDISCIAR